MMSTIGDCQVRISTAADERAMALDPLPLDGGWSVVVVLHRESAAQALHNIAAIAAASRGPLVVDVLVNGRDDLAQALAIALPEGLSVKPGLVLRLWSIEFGDKANAWNEYIHRIWPGKGTTFFVDGYVSVHQDALERLAARLAQTPSALAAAAVPTHGHSAAALRGAMISGGGLHGNLFAVSERAMTGLRQRRFRLPLGLYRVDGTLGAVLSFALDPESNDWDPRSRISVVADASWDVDPGVWWRWRDLRSGWLRRMRQAQGVLENRAVRDWFSVRRQAIGSLPPTALALVEAWRSEHRGEYRHLALRRPLVHVAWLRLRSHRQHGAHPASHMARLVGQWPGGISRADPGSTSVSTPAPAC